jgi:hypothetical protein
VTVATDFFDWQRSGLNPKRAPWTKCSPALVAIEEYLVEKWGGKRLGCHDDRSIRDGDSISSHAFGAALDWRYSDPGPGRKVLLSDIIPFLIENSKELGVQAIHDYVGCRIWRCNRANDSNGGWKEQPKAGQMGQAWAQWIHIEVNRAQWKDGRSVDEKIGGAKPEPWPPFNPEKGEFGLYPLNPNKAWIRLNSRGDLVKYLQGVLRKNRYQIAVDGNFGPQTRDRVIRFQRANGLLADGIVGSKTWAKIDQASR